MVNQLQKIVLFGLVSAVGFNIQGMHDQQITAEQDSSEDGVSTVLIIGSVAAGAALMCAAAGTYAFLKKIYRASTIKSINCHLHAICHYGSIPPEINNLIKMIREPQRRISLGVEYPKGILLYGPPGTGKTSLARYLAAVCKCPFFQKTGTEFLTSLVGETERNIREFFNAAQQAAEGEKPVILFIDEIDAIGIDDGHMNHITHLKQLLTCMDGFEQKSNIIIIATTNNKERLAPALTRPGRFDWHLKVGLPSDKDRAEILCAYSQKSVCSLCSPDSATEATHRCSLQCNQELLTQLVQETAGLTPAYLKALVQKAAALAFARDSNAVEKQDFKAALESIKNQALKG